MLSTYSSRFRTIIPLRISSNFLFFNLQSRLTSAVNAKNMPKDRTHIAEAQKQRHKIKERNSKYVPGKVTLQVLGTGAEGAPRSVYIFTDQTRYMFNCGEGTQRLAHEHKAKLAKLENIFITQATWKNMGGLPGSALTMQDVGVPEINLHGPPGIVELFRAAKRFVRMKNMKVEMADCSTDFEDNVMTVKYVSLMPVPSHQEEILLNVDSAIDKITQAGSNMATSNVGTTTRSSRKKRRRSLSCESNLWYSSDSEDNQNHDADGRKRRRARSFSVQLSRRAPVDGFIFTDEMKQTLLEQKKRGSVMCYVCRLKSKPGSLNLSKCVELKIPAGPKLGDLKNGKSVTLSDGTIVTPEQVCEPEEPGPVFIIVDVPSENYLDSLITNNTINGHNQNASLPDAIAYVVVHFTPSHVVQHSGYQNWLDNFSPSTHHIFVNDKNTCMGSIAVHRIQYKLNLLNKNIFPLLGDRGTERLQKQGLKEQSVEDSTLKPMVVAESSKAEHVSSSKQISATQPGTFFSFHLRPRLGNDRSTEIKLNPSEYIDETYALDGFCDEVQKYRIERPKKWEEMSARISPITCWAYPKVLFLGTGSCIPNKTRNTSGIMVFTSETSNILLDCGEGTYGQTIRFFGEKEAMSIVANTNAIYISHLHADHHIGLIGYLQGRQRARKLLGLPDKKCFVVAPKELKGWLSFYDICFEDLCDQFIFIANSDLIPDKQRDTFTPVHSTDAEREELFEAANMREIRTCEVRHTSKPFGISLTHENGYKLTYSGDTMPCENLVKLGDCSDLLIHEATMEDDLCGEAIAKMHSTTSQAIRMGCSMSAKNVVLTHFSQRYAKVPRYNPGFDDHIGIAFDNMMLSPNEIPLLPLLYPSLLIMFADHCEDMEHKAMKRARREEQKQCTSKNAD